MVELCAIFLSIMVDVNSSLDPNVGFSPTRRRGRGRLSSKSKGSIRVMSRYWSGNPEHGKVAVAGERLRTRSKYIVRGLAQFVLYAGTTIFVGSICKRTVSSWVIN
jgi:hypothetical protein